MTNNSKSPLKICDKHVDGTKSLFCLWDNIFLWTNQSD